MLRVVPIVPIPAVTSSVTILVVPLDHSLRVPLSLSLFGEEDLENSQNLRTEPQVIK